MRSLFLSYDGMTDPLGSSQVIPYLRGLSERGHEVTILSAEKPDRLDRSGDAIGKLLRSSGIDWRPMRYHKRPPMLSTVWDLSRMRARADALSREKRIELVHCRSYVPSLVGLGLKRRRGLGFLFDMRGFWADERVDGGLWDLNRPHYRLAYDFFKRRELCFLNESDRTVSLTHAGRAEMLRWRIEADAKERIEVIPCCADLEHFRRERVSAGDQVRARQELGIAEGDFVVSYLGSIGTWYLLDEMLRFFARLRAGRPEAKFLFITPDGPEAIRAAAARAGVPEQALAVREASRAEVPLYLSLSSLGLFFIKPAYSKISSSPTKMAEILSMGIPVVMNAGVGDADWIAAQCRVGALVRDFADESFDRAIRSLPEVLAIPPAEIRAVAQEHFSLESGVEAYHRIYTAIAQEIQ